MIVKNRLLDFDFVIFQDDEWFKFSLDSVLLVNFVSLNLRCKKIIDLASGNAPIPMLLTLRTNNVIDAIEYQECVYNLGKKSILENGLDGQINLICGDVRSINNFYNSDTYDTVLCNPPYFKTLSSSYLNENDVKKIARHEITLNLDDVLKSAKYLLKNGGNFAMVHRTERFIEIISKFRDYNLEPKRVQFIHSKKDKDSDLFLIEGVKNGRSGLKVMPDIYIHNEDGTYTDDVRKLFSNRK